MNKQFNVYTDAELKSFITAAEQELANRKNKKFDELAKNACDALNALVKEFPSIRCEINASVTCDRCDEDFDYWVDIFDCVNKFTPDMFIK